MKAMHVLRVEWVRRAAALALLVLMLVASIPVAGLAATASAEKVTDATNATATTTVALNATSGPANANVEQLRAKLLLVSGLLRGLLMSMNLSLNASPATVAAVLGVNETVAEKLLEIADMTPEQIAGMTLDQLRATLHEAHVIYHLVTGKALRVAEQARALLEERLKLKMARRLAELAKKLAAEVNDTELLRLAEQLEAAIRQGNMKAALMLEERLLARIEAENVYAMSGTLANAFTNLLEAMAKAGNATGIDIHLIEKLLHDLKKATSIVERIAKKAATPDVAAKLAAAASMLSDVNTTAAAAAALGPGTSAVAAAAEAWAARLQARIQLAYKAALDANDTVALRLLEEANRTLTGAMKAIEAGDYASALRLLASADRLVVRAEARLALASMRELMEEIKARHGMPELLPPSVIRKHLLPVATLPAAVAAKTPAAVESLARRANSTIAATVALLEALNRTVKEYNITLSDGVKALIEKAWGLLEEANRTLADAEKLLAEGNYTGAAAKALAALRLAVEARSYAHAALGAVTAEAGMRHGIELAKEIRRMVKEQAKKMIEHATKIVEEVRRKAESIIEKAKKAAEKAAEEARKRVEKAKKRAEERVRHVFNETAATAANKTMTALIGLAERLRLAVKAYADLGVNTTEANMSLAEAMQLLSNANVQLQEALRLAAAGNITEAQARLEAAMQLLQQAAERLQQAAKALAEAVTASGLMEKARAMAQHARMLAKEAEEAVEAARHGLEAAAALNAPVTVKVNTTMAQRVLDLANQAMWMINESLRSLQEAAKTMNVTLMANAAVLLEQAMQRLQEAQALAANLTRQTEEALSNVIARAEEQATVLLADANNLTAAVQVLTAAGFNISGEASARLANVTNMLNEAKKLLEEARNMLEQANLTAAAEALSQAKQALTAAARELRTALRLVHQELMEARQELLDRIAVLEQNVTSLEARIQELMPKAAANATLASKLGEAQSLLAQAQTRLENAKALLQWGGNETVDQHGKSHAETNASIGLEAEIGAEIATITVRATLLVQAKVEIDAAASLIQQAAGLVAEVEAAVQASSGGSQTMPTPPIPGTKP